MPLTWGLALLGQDVVTSTSATWHLQSRLDVFQFSYLLLSSSSVFHWALVPGGRFSNAPTTPSPVRYVPYCPSVHHCWGDSKNVVACKLINSLQLAKMRHIITLFFFSIPVFASAQKQDTAFMLNSVFVKDSFKISIGQIIKSPSDKILFPVYTLDGDETFVGTKFALNSLSSLTKNILIVSIGYGATYGQKGNMRDRDYSPIKADTSSGNKFLQFISKELIPLVEKKYDLKKERTLIGYSAGANFCLYTLLTHQKIFTNYLAGSIGSSLDSNYIFNKLKKVKLKKMQTKLFISSGSKENWATEKLNSIISNLTNKNKNLISIKQQIFDGQEHGKIGAFAFLKESLKWIFIDN